MRPEDTELIGVGGLAGAGKDTYAELMQDLYPEKKFFVIGMSDILRDSIEAVNPWIEYAEDEFIRFNDIIEDHTEHGNYSYADAYTLAKTIPDVRDFLQKLGTEVGRRLISKNVWVDATRTRIRALREVGYSVILTGVRFPNELEMVTSEGGRSVFIINENVLKVNTHASETSISQDDFDTIIYNNASIDALKEYLKREENNE